MNAPNGSGSQRRSKGRQASNKSSNTRGSGNAGASKATASKRSKRRRKSNAKAAKEFWGDLGALPSDVPQVRVSAEPAAVVASLGKAPLTNNEAAADQYLKVAYQRAVMMAGALAAAGDLVEEDDLT